MYARLPVVTHGEGLEPEHRLQLNQVLPPCLLAQAILVPAFHWHFELRGHHAQQGRKRKLIDAQKDAGKSQVGVASENGKNRTLSVH